MTTKAVNKTAKPLLLYQYSHQTNSRQITAIDVLRSLIGELPNRVAAAVVYLALYYQHCFFSQYELLALQGQRCFKAHWFYEEHDTAMACRDAASQKVYMPTKEGAGDKSRLWLATVEDNEQYGLCYDLNVIAK